MLVTERRHFVTALSLVLAQCALSCVGASEPEAMFGPTLQHVSVDAESVPGLHSLLVSRRGALVLERYFDGHGPAEVANVKSVSKSIISALVGIAIERGVIDSVDATIAQYLPESLGPDSGPKSTITIEQLLTMQAGLRSTSNDRYGPWVASRDWVAAALAQPLDWQPGSHMAYSTGNTHLLSAILTRATGESTFDFAREVLAEPLGFELASWPRDPQGIFFGGNDMELTPRQMLAFGRLYLDRGRFADRQVVPADWIDASLTPHAQSEQGDARYYGYGWWICTLAGYRAPHAWGYGGQFIILVPELDVVIVTTAGTERTTDGRTYAAGIYDFIQTEVIPAVAAAELPTLAAAR
jgi:CubicO group peptidase (beta-lactamase class C family)